METTVKVMYEDILVGEVHTNRSLSVDEALNLIGFDEAKFIEQNGFDDIDYNDFRLEYKKIKSENKMIKIKKVVEIKENFPLDGERYIVGLGENGKYFFAWGPEIPYEDEVPSYDISEGESGIEWFATEKQASAAMNAAAGAVENH